MSNGRMRLIVDMLEFDMKKKERVTFWVKSADEAYKMAKFLFENKKYADGLFYGQLCIEKMVKAVFISKNDSAPPYVHNLVFLAGKADLEMDSEMIENLREISTFNINARYDDYKNSFYLKATEDYANRYLKII